jgi:plastocyanin
MIPIPLVCKLVAAALTVATPVKVSAAIPAELAAPVPVVITDQASEGVPMRNSGTVEGQVTFEGMTPPKRRIIPIKDQQICGAREEERISLSPDRFVLGALVYLQDVENGKHWAGAASVPLLDITNCEFRPRLQVVRTGEIEFLNSDPIAHKVRLSRDLATVYHVELRKHLRVKKQLEEPGLYRVECEDHEGALAWIYVAENPYYDQTKEDGSFRITDVPPGRYTLVVWHEYTGEEPIPLTVKANQVVSVRVKLKR